MLDGIKCLFDPVNLIDPDGLFWGKIGGFVGGKIGKFIRKKIAKKIGKEWGDKEQGDGTTNGSPKQIEMDNDHDGDKLNDYFDPDDDNDGIPDTVDSNPKTEFYPVPPQPVTYPIPQDDNTDREYSECPN